MQSTELGFTSDGARMAGTLLAPSSTPAPVAVLISGSGPIDRDSNMKRKKLTMARDIAKHLASVGIATYRYDKRGVGASEGDYRASGLHDNIADGRAAVAAVRHRDDVAAGRVFVIGHSEGAIIAAALSAEDADLAGAVLLAGPAHTGEQVLKWQGGQIAATLPRPVKWLLKLFRKDFLTIQDKRLTKLKKSQGDVVRMQFIRINAKWFREFLAHDPADSLRRAKVPILAITGAKDIQVDPGDVALMEELVRSGFTGEVVPNLTHLLRREEGPAGLKTNRKQMKRPVDRRLLEMVGAWVNDVAAAPKEVNHESL